MTSSTPYTIRWGIMATGGIAETFCRDLLTDPTARDVHDVSHAIVAVASSSSSDRAAAFIGKIDGLASARAYGSYADLVADPDVDIIYVATPHSHHFQNAMLALTAGKNVLCEKALTVTAAQARKLVDMARRENVFLMEAVWTRFFPLSVRVRELISSGEIGTVHRTMADLSLNFSSDPDDGKMTLADSHRMVNKHLAGGALLDLGVYALTWVFQTLYHLQQPSSASTTPSSPSSPLREAPAVLAAMDRYHTGADENTSIICHFPRTRAMGIATTSLRVGTSPHGQATAAPAIRIQGSQGEIQVAHPAYRPTSYRVLRRRGDGDGDVEVVECPIPVDSKRGSWGHGMFWEADECARCLRDGRKQSEVMPWEESVVMMEVMEEALRQGGVAYPDLITSDVFDAQSPLNTGTR
ncbi:D-xylose 1-dehydrogenase (NADP(+)) [Claviceps africana]|uniref:D-xylose 1-dehydrogenase (NADP(+), D-xylono-1,5-lactone-forming) n=1 Tax=Claviceps africana TaxID=83212 RepID=A0A8K0NF14_9HYPO|nr:D-xylose 1-dehydrogenase (NADP(+)) [Claviceps africana]